MFKTFFFADTCSNFDNKFVLRYFNKSVVFWHYSFLNQNFFNFLSIFRGTVLWIIASCSFFVWKLNQSIRLIIFKDVFSNSIPNFIKLLNMIWPVWREFPKVNKYLLAAFRNKFAVTKRFKVSCILQKCCNVNENFWKVLLWYFALQFFSNFLWSDTRKSFQYYIEKCRRLIRSLKEAYLGSIPRSSGKVIGIECLL